MKKGGGGGGMHDLKDEWRDARVMNKPIEKLCTESHRLNDLDNRTLVGGARVGAFNTF
jgi:hypothetical protein